MFSVIYMERVKLNLEGFDAELVKNDDAKVWEYMPDPNLVLVGVSHRISLYEKQIPLILKRTIEAEVVLTESGPYFEGIQEYDKKFRAYVENKLYIKIPDVAYKMIDTKLNYNIDFTENIILYNGVAALVIEEFLRFGINIQLATALIVFYMAKLIGINTNIINHIYGVKLRKLLTPDFFRKYPGCESWLAHNNLNLVITGRSYLMGYKILQMKRNNPDKRICVIMGDYHASFLHNKFLYTEGIEEIESKARMFLRLYRPLIKKEFSTG